MEAGDFFTVHWGRKGALLLLAVVVAWTAVPVSACLLSAQAAGMPACCRGMAPDCPMHGMRADTSCCRIDGRDAAFTPVPPYSPEHSQRLVFVSQQASLDSPTAPRAGRSNALEAPPPKFPPGRISILRI